MYETFTVVIAMIVTLGFGVAVGWWTAAKAFKLEIHGIESRVADDQANYLMILRRELANYVIRREPVRFINAYKKNHEDLKQYEKFSKAALIGEYTALCKRFKYFRDLDIVETRSHVLYEDAFEGMSVDDVLAHHWTICKFQRLKILLDAHWASFGVTSDQDLAHCEEYVTAITDAKFVVRLENAIKTYYGSRVAVFADFENDEISVRSLDSFLETRYGVGFKDTNEFGIWSVFYFDEVDKAPLITYRRSDSSFTVETSVQTRLKDFFS